MRDYDREVLRGALVSLFWNIIAFRKKQNGFSLSALAAAIGVNKSAPSRWFGEEKPNWTANTVADIANALDVEIEVYARDRKSGKRFAVYGVVATAGTIAPRTNRPISQASPGPATNPLSGNLATLARVN